MSLGTRCYKGQHQHKQAGSPCHDVPSGVRKIVRVSAAHVPAQFAVQLTVTPKHVQIAQVN